MTDTQLVDEESPARVEFVDRIGPPYEAAYRPHEGLMPMVLAQEVRAVRALRPELVMVTGDNTDNTQRNETRWFVDALDGGVVTPDSGVRGTCRAPSGFGGVHGGRRYYEPDRSTGQDGPGYSPSVRVNRRTVKRSNAVRDYPGLLDEMNRPFRSPGLGVPWYSVIGNHDALVQGNVPGIPFFSQVAMGCLKVTDLSANAWGQIRPLLGDGITEEEASRIVQTIYGDVLATTSNPGRHRRLWKRVRRDPARALLFRKPDWMREHFTTRGAPAGHGFTQANLESGEGNYAFSPKPGLRFVVLDSVAAAGSDGNLDHAQFLWLHAQLLAAETAHELVIVFAHHSLPSMSQRQLNAHYGLTGSCPSALPQTPPAPDESVRCLLQRHRSVIALVAGHSHRNRITPYPAHGRRRLLGDRHVVPCRLAPAVPHDLARRQRRRHPRAHDEGRRAELAPAAGQARSPPWPPLATRRSDAPGLDSAGARIQRPARGERRGRVPRPAGYPARPERRAPSSEPLLVGYRLAVAVEVVVGHLGLFDDFVLEDLHVVGVRRVDLDNAVSAKVDTQEKAGRVPHREMPDQLVVRLAALMVEREEWEVPLVLDGISHIHLQTDSDR